MQTASLVLVGSGIKFLAHLTSEAKAYIEQSDKVLYLVNDPVMQEWIQQANPKSESLETLYRAFPQRLACYQAITRYILEQVREQQHICVVLYGHPCVFAMPGLEAVKQAREEGIFAKILPGISAEDCLFADLCIDPGTQGCQSYEATDFLIRQRRFDPTTHLLLWQADVIGLESNPTSGVNRQGLTVLVTYLLAFYPPSHPVILYEAAQYPGFEPRIETVELEMLSVAALSSITTLYVPPLPAREYDAALLKKMLPSV
jgi:uncharacterized protein YabN with tetrapyrrole methylase and pyrophosphatase domain